VRQGVVAIKGSSKRGSAAVSKGNKVDVNWKGRIVKRGVVLYSVGSDTIKTTLFGRMRHNEDGPGGLRFGMAADEEYFKQLTAEKQTLRYLKGFPVREWVKKPSMRNESLDCAVYAYAALQLSYRKFNRATMWEQLRQQLEGGGKAPLRSRKQQPAAAAPGFVSNW
jgi:phage terminase large subunit GpA-like protein